MGHLNRLIGVRLTSYNPGIDRLRAGVGALGELRNINQRSARQDWRIVRHSLSPSATATPCVGLSREGRQASSDRHEPGTRHRCFASDIRRATAPLGRQLLALGAGRDSLWPRRRMEQPNGQLEQTAPGATEALRLRAWWLHLRSCCIAPAGSPPLLNCNRVRLTRTIQALILSGLPSEL